MLPHVLLDLLCYRLSSAANSTIAHPHARNQIRQLQRVAARPVRTGAERHEGHRVHASYTGGNDTVRSNHPSQPYQANLQIEAVSALEKRMVALKSTTEMPPSLVETAFNEGRHYKEEELREIFKDLLTFPETGVDTTEKYEDTSRHSKEQYPELLHILEERLSTFEGAVTVTTGTQDSLSSRLLIQKFKNSQKENAEGFPIASHETWLHEENTLLRKLVNHLSSVFNRLEDVWKCTGYALSSAPPPLPLGILSNTEWGALCQTCLNANDLLASEQVLTLMKRSGVAPSYKQYDSILEGYAEKGSIEQADTFFSRMGIDLSRDRQRDLLIKVRVTAKRLDDACALIHSFETHATPAPMQSYTRVIHALLHQRGPGSEVQKAQAWDIFSHMRYVAHPVPDAYLYSIMMRAVADSPDPEAERVLDLFTEMTIDNKIPPTTYTYNAVILTCARAKNFQLEAFRLAREMLNSHRDAFGEIPSHLQPDKNTFVALLEAAKRLKDLPRARWVLAQMMQESRHQAKRGQSSIYIDSTIISNIFHAYASYRPPFRREVIALGPGDEAAPTYSSNHHEVSAKSIASGQENDFSRDHVLEASEALDTKVTNTSQRRGVPQTHQEIIKEVSALWERILEDIENATKCIQLGSPQQHFVFGRVSLTTMLLNSFMTVHFNHSSAATAFEVHKDLYESLGVPRDALTHIAALEAYGQGKRSEEQLQVALAYARKVWKDWRRMEDVGVSQISTNRFSGDTVDARVVERAWIAMMRLLTLNGHLDEAMTLLREFVECYPPAYVKQTSPFDPRRSSRITLYAERPLVRLTERSSVNEDRIAPFVTFRDLELLHHRAVSMKQPGYISYITWVSKAYEGCLRQRRNAALKPDREN